MIKASYTTTEVEIRLGEWFFRNVEKHGGKVAAWAPFAIAELSKIAKILRYADVRQEIQIAIRTERKEAWNVEDSAEKRVNKALGYSVGNWKSYGKTDGTYGEARNDSK